MNPVILAIGVMVISSLNRKRRKQAATRRRRRRRWQRLSAKGWEPVGPPFWRCSPGISTATSFTCPIWRSTSLYFVWKLNSNGNESVRCLYRRLDLNRWMWNWLDGSTRWMSEIWLRLFIRWTFEPFPATWQRRRWSGWMWGRKRSAVTRRPPWPPLTT